METGTAMQVGSILAGEYDPWAESLAFAPDGAAYVSFTFYPRQLGSATAGKLVRSTTSGGQTGEIRLPLTSGPTSIAFAPEGLLYGIRGPEQPWTIDLNTGVFNQARRVSASDIAASPNGQLYGVSYAWSNINLDSGAFTLTSLVSSGGYAPESVASFTFCPNGYYDRIGYVDCCCWLDCAGCGSVIGCYLDLACAPDGTLLALDGNQIVTLEDYHKVMIPVATLDSPLDAWAFAANGNAYGVGGSQLVTVDVTTGHVVPIGPLGTAIGDITYIPAKMSLQKLHSLGACVKGPDAPLFNGCGDYDFDGDGSVDLRDVSGLWLVIPE
jgi:hypothetical protein